MRQITAGLGWRLHGVPVGDIRAASYGHTLGGAVGLAMVEGEVVNQAYLDDPWSFM